MHTINYSIIYNYLFFISFSTPLVCLLNYWTSLRETFRLFVSFEGTQILMIKDFSKLHLTNTFFECVNDETQFDSLDFRNCFQTTLNCLDTLSTSLYIAYYVLAE